LLRHKRQHEHNTNKKYTRIEHNIKYKLYKTYELVKVAYNLRAYVKDTS